MYNYSERIESFRDEKVRLSAEFLEKLLRHRKANRDRLISRLPDLTDGVTIGESSFRPQGSVATQTVIQTRFVDEEYDIDDGVVLWKHQLVDGEGNEFTARQMRELVREALKDGRFSRQPKLCSNCVRVFYADDDDEKHHVDIPIYRRFFDADGKKVRELANENGWVISDPTEVNKWFDSEIASRNDAHPCRGTQLRQLIQLLKRFCRSRSDWDLPNGMKLTMLVAECQPPYRERIDQAFRDLVTNLKNRLFWNKVIRNLAHKDKPAITRTDADQNVVDLEARLGEAAQQLNTLDGTDANNMDSARKVWDWIFKSDGFFAAFDETKKKEEKEQSLLAKAALIGNGANTSPLGVLGSFGVTNQAHAFYGEEYMD
ncbi:MAG: cyclic GMP-AMP synthase DncV-like nucleotidyltransferase [Chthoniobacteraceae bacterium]